LLQKICLKKLRQKPETVTHFRETECAKDCSPLAQVVQKPKASPLIATDQNRQASLRQSLTLVCCAYGKANPAWKLPLDSRTENRHSRLLAEHTAAPKPFS
jgi:hypothetical protein